MQYQHLKQAKHNITNKNKQNNKTQLVLQVFGYKPKACTDTCVWPDGGAT